MGEKIRVGVVGTSWWADAMYMPAIAAHPLADVRAVVGATRPEHARAFADAWGVPAVHGSVDAMLEAEDLDAVLVLSRNDDHMRSSLAAIERGLHVLCEKPLAQSARDARVMAEAAGRAGVITMVPFTYRFMPVNRYVKELMDDGFIGRPYSLDMRYFTGYGRSGAYMWRFDEDVAGSGVSGDIGSHFVYLARWFFGEVDAVTAVYTHVVPREPRPDGEAYTVADDSAMILLEFANGATGNIHVTSLAYEPGDFGQRHDMDLHGTGGTIHATTDWVNVQRLEGCRADEDAIRPLPIPDHIWGDARRDDVHETYKDVFRRQDHMTRAFITAVAEGRATSPDFADGLAVQRIIDAAGLSAREGRRVRVAEIVDAGG